MYILTHNEQGELVKYDKVGNLSFAPEIDLTGQSLPINEFYVDIYTEENIPIAQSIFLYDNDDKLWAKYWIVLANHTSEYTVTIHAESYLARLDRSYVKAVMYTSPEPIERIIYALFKNNADMFSIDARLANKTVSGYFPKQTRKERLQWICFAIGAYVKTCFTDKVEIRKIDTTVETIPVHKTFWKPLLSFSDYVKSITLNFFSFDEKQKEEIGSTEEYVKVDGKYYTIAREEFVLSNDAETPKNVAVQEIEFNDIYILNSSNVDNVANYLGQMYFNNCELDADIVNNAEFEPAHLVEISVDPPDSIRGRTAIGYIDSCDFAFGVQAKSRIHMLVTEIKETTTLIVNYVHLRGLSLGRQRYNLAEGFGYSITNPYLDKASGKIRKVFYPINEKATGTMHSGVNTNTQKYDDALIYDASNKKNELEILSVSGITLDDKGVLTIE